ncbi:MAG: 7-carboxy-7-deazaguanine synthase QueE [Planctomycetes bacterium]|nr:7-carboxy-7-deazaguanine synthase QueE [Planctomycetota bacterium]
MKIAEHYLSIQGEGALTGVESVFVRTSGCNLRCWFCDTPFTSWHPEGDDLAIDEILARIERHDCPHVVITGGEPMLHAELVPLTERLHALGKHITIETAGTLYLPVRCDLMSISPKLSNSAPPRSEDPRWHARHERTRNAPDVIAHLVAEYDYQVKFVVDTPADCDEVEGYLAKMRCIERDRVWLMPQGIQPEALVKQGEWLRPHCKQAGLHFCARRHIEWFGLVRGT